jgi:hypothetical protein
LGVNRKLSKRTTIFHFLGGIHPKLNEFEALLWQGMSATVLSFFTCLLLILSPDIILGKVLLMGCSSLCSVTARATELLQEGPSEWKPGIGLGYTKSSAHTH